jgi:trimeric autotransporter adhesin
MKKLVLFAALLGLPLSGFAQVAEDPTYDVPYALDTRAAFTVSSARAADGSFVLFQDRVRVEGANSLQLLFAEAQLGQTGFVRIRSVQDGGTQQMNAAQLAEWSNHTAFFNGDEVEISLQASKPEPGLFFRLETVRAEDAGFVSPATLCEPGDTRRLSQDKRIGRAAPTGCTAWIIENGTLLTAGHCVASNRLNTVSFNVPPSGPNGRVQAAPQDQYPVTIGTNTNTGIGSDYSILIPGRGSRGMPMQVQGAAFKVSTNPTNTRNVTITGFGSSAVATLNASQTTDSGPFLGQSGTGNRVRLNYRASTTGGDSGSPIIADDGVTALGIHTNGGCNANGGGSNSGTSFNNQALLQAIRAAGQIDIQQ